MAFRIAAAFFAATTVFMATIFVRALGEREIRSGVLTFALASGAAAIGLWRRTRWGRGLALVMALGNAGFGTLAVLSVIISGRGSLPGPIVLLIVSTAVAYLLSRRVFEISYDD